MTTQAVAERFFELATEGKFQQILTELFHPDAESIEPENAPFRTVKGLDNILKKGQEWQEVVEEMHGGYTNAPIVGGHFFACTMGMDVTIKGQGRTQLDEVAVYEVRDGKIRKEQFFY